MMCWSNDNSFLCLIEWIKQKETIIKRQFKIIGRINMWWILNDLKNFNKINIGKKKTVYHL